MQRCRFLHMCYVLLAVLGSAGVVSPVGAPTRTFTYLSCPVATAPLRRIARRTDADAVTQPSGGAESLPGQAPGGDPDRTSQRRRHGKEKQISSGTRTASQEEPWTGALESAGR
jgi:hypothetical protein